MQFEVLSGPAVLHDDAGGRIALQPLRAAAVTALVYTGRPVTAETFIDLLWGDGRHAAHRRSLNQLWSALKASSPDLALRLRHDQGRYRLAPVEGDYVDLVAYRSRARRALDIGVRDPLCAVEILRFALAMFPPVGTTAWLPATPAMTETLDILLNERLDLVGELAMLLMDLGEWKEAIQLLHGELNGRGDREDLVGLRMRALYGADRKPEALGVYRAHQDWLRAEMDAEPGPGIQTLSEQIARNDGALPTKAVISPWLPSDEDVLSALGAGDDPRRPSVTRMYDAAVGGRFNLPADRARAAVLRCAAPAPVVDQQHVHRFTVRVIKEALLNHDIRLVLDFGTPVPTDQYGAHNIAARFAPGTRVLYTTRDPLIARAFAAADADPALTRMLVATLREAERCADSEEFRDFDVFGQPALYLFHNEHNIESDLAAILDYWIERAAAGSIFALTLSTAEGMTDRVTRALGDIYADLAGDAFRPRTRQDLAALTEGLELLAPIGYVEEVFNRLPEDPGEFRILGAVAIKR